MDAQKDLQTCFKISGIDEKKGKFGFRIYFFLVIYVVISINIGYFLIEEWEDMDKRIIGLKSILFIATFSGYVVSYLCYWDDFSTTYRTIFEANTIFPYQVSIRRKSIMESLQNDVKTYNKWWSIMLYFYGGCLLFGPACLVLVKIVILSQDFRITIRDTLSSPYPIYYPKFIENYGDIAILITYLCGYGIQIFYIILSCSLALLSNVISLGSMSNVQHELQLLRLSIFEMENYIKINDSTNTSSINTLKSFFNYFVRHHQYVYKKFVTVSAGVRWVAIIISMVSVLYMCMSVFTIAQEDEFLVQIQEGTYFIVWAFAIYFLDISGEKIKSDHEKLRDALYQCSWVDKPIWFKKALLVVMTRTTRSADVKPLGIFSMTHESFAATMKAAYSYYNLLHNFNDN